MDDHELQLWAPITKMDAGTREIEGPISGPDNTDLDGQIVDTAWLRAAVGPWSGFGNIRQQHDPRKPVGKATTVDMNTASGVPVVRARIVDDNAWKLIQEGVLSGFSIGVKNPIIVHDKGAPKGRIVGGNLVEVSVVDHPANMEAKFAICKSIDGGWYDYQTKAVIDKAAGYEAKEHDELKDTKPGVGSGMCSCCGVAQAGCTCPAGADCCECAGSGAGHGADMPNEDLDKGASPHKPPHDPEHAPDFREFAHADGIKPDHETPANLGSAPASGPSVTPEVSQHADIRRIARTIAAMAARLDTYTAAGFNPNANPATRREPPRTESPDFEDIAGFPDDDMSWHGDQPAFSKGADADSPFAISAEEVYTIAKEAALDALTDLLGGGTTLSKAATPDTTKAALADTLKGILAASGIEQRLAKVEGTAAASKGVANDSMVRAVEKNFALNNAERQVLDDTIGKQIESLPEDQKLALAAQYIHQHTYGRPA